MSEQLSITIICGLVAGVVWFVLTGTAASLLQVSRSRRTRLQQGRELGAAIRRYEKQLEEEGK